MYINYKLYLRGIDLNISCSDKSGLLLIYPARQVYKVSSSITDAAHVISMGRDRGRFAQ